MTEKSDEINALDQDPTSWLSQVNGGLCYFESGSPPALSESQYEHLYGPWYKDLQDM